MESNIAAIAPPKVRALAHTLLATCCVSACCEHPPFLGFHEVDESVGISACRRGHAEFARYALRKAGTIIFVDEPGAGALVPAFGAFFNDAAIWHVRVFPKNLALGLRVFFSALCDPVEFRYTAFLAQMPPSISHAELVAMVRIFKFDSGNVSIICAVATSLTASLAKDTSIRLP